jgi:hypothetical protein
MEHLQVRVVRSDKVANVYIANGDCAGEWGCDTLKGNFLLKEAEIGAKRLEVSLVGRLRGSCVFGVKL